MNDAPITDAMIWGWYQPLIELLFAGIFAALILQGVVTLILMGCLCREGVRAKRRLAAGTTAAARSETAVTSPDPSPEENGAPVDSTPKSLEHLAHHVVFGH